MQHDLVMRALSQAEGVMTIQVSGVVDAHTLDRFERGLARALEHGATSLLLDCEELRYVNSSGFGELIRYFDRLRELGGTLVLARVPPKVGVILEMLGLKSIIPIVTSLPEGAKVAARGAAAAPAEAPEPPAARAGIERLPQAPPASRVTVAAHAPQPDGRVILCPLCDTHTRVGGEGRWACPGCGAPFSVTLEGGVAFDWSTADADALHLTLEVSPRTLAAFAGLLEGVLTERRLAHAAVRRFAREAAHVCHLVSQNAYPGDRGGPLHILVQAGAERLAVRIVDRGRSIGEQSRLVFGTQAHLFLDFRYRTLASGVNATEFAFSYQEANAYAT